MNRCPVNRKRQYQSKVEALLDNANKPLMARAYRCRSCGFWHLTRRLRERV